MAPTSIDGNDITGATIDGQDVSEITVDGQTVFTAIPDSVVNNLDVWYPMGEGSGTTLTDALETVDASFPAGTWTSDQNYTQGNAVSLDGADDYWASDSTVALSTSELSICGWFNPSTFNQNASLGGMATTQDPFDGSGVLVSTRDDGTVRGWLVDYTNGGNGGQVNLGGATEQWYFFGFVADISSGSSTLFVWDNDSFIGSDTQSSPSPSFSDVLLSGGNGPELHFHGLQDAIGYALDTQLSQSQFADIWQDTQR